MSRTDYRLAALVIGIFGALMVLALVLDPPLLRPTPFVVFEPEQ